MRRLACLAVFWLALFVTAQEPASTPLAAGSSSGLAVTGRIDNNAPRQVYTFEGSRGEVVRITLEVTNGDLDPTLALFEATGRALVVQDDSDDQRQMSVTVSLQRDMPHYLIVGRFGLNVGTTRGEYRLKLERVGVVSEQGSTLLYGVPVTGTISNAQPQIFYTFRANRGDVLTIEMQRTSGTLDPYLQVLDSNRFLLASNDDVPEGGSHNSRIDNFIAPETGVYIVVASRYGESAGDTVGNFILSVYEGQFSGIGASSVMPELVEPDQPVTGEITNNQPQRYYRFSAREDDVIDILMARTSGSLDAYLILQDMNGQTLFQDDDSGGGKNAAINGFRIPQNGSYIIIAQRFEGANGSTAGGYRLTLRNRGDAYAGVNIGIPRLLYGTTVPDAISNADPDSLYAFYGMRGEVVTITMTRTSGNLDPVLVLLDQAQQRLISDDDSGGSSNAAITRYTLPYTGVYYINARRYEGNRGTRNSEGTFNVVLVRVSPAPGGS